MPFRVGGGVLGGGYTCWRISFTAAVAPFQASAALTSWGAVVAAVCVVADASDLRNMVVCLPWCRRVCDTEHQRLFVI
jgi:hypothetical protein